MTESSGSLIMSLSSPSFKVAAILSCLLFMGMQTVWAQSSSDNKQSDSKVVVQKRVEKNIPGTYHYESQYKMTKDEKGNYRSTYESQKHEWFCCLDWFSSEDEPSTKAGKS